MELLDYWPTRENINQCIRTEAEELAEHTLLAVHEPMRLMRKGVSEDISCRDEDLLSDFLQTERPIPIIGRSGVGKSHLIRWLHAKLKLQPDAGDWHIVRIPKNASLRQVLDLILVGLKGDVFEQARQRVKKVGEQLNTLEVAELLLMFMGQQLRKEFERAQETIRYHQRTENRPSREESDRLRAIHTHCSEMGLPALINDRHFQANLLNEGHCILQFARRLTDGANDAELTDYDYQIHAVDLDFNYNLSDLSLPARQYVQTAQLNTSEEKRQKAAEMLNLVLGEATRTAFQQLFQFSGSNNFQELFKQIRRDLHKKGQTLVVLVEDMAAISAIEDVLIDSLLEEGMYEGVERMCSLRSAIAVTDGYSGYLRRKDTLLTRAKAEWWIEELQEGESEGMLEQRIVDFCSRYINAARHGNNSLEEHWKSKADNPWPPIWENEEIDRQNLDAFGKASIGISLYPFSPLAIRAMVNNYCRDNQGNLRFNPRQVINEILLKVLRDHRNDAEHGQFPPVMLGSVHPPGVLRSELATLGLKEPGRCESLVAVWGYEAENLADLKEKLSADIALEFGLNDLGGHLNSGTVELPHVPKPKSPGTTATPTPDPSPVPEPEEVKLKALLSELDLWFQRKKELPQTEAKQLRNALAQMYQTYARKDWSGIGELPPIKAKGFVNIWLPYAMANRKGSMVKFCSETQFSDPDKSIPFHNAARALLRHHYYNPVPTNDKGWNYPHGHEDILHYQNFATQWVPYAVCTLRDYERTKLEDALADQFTCARALAVIKEKDTRRECLNKLLQSRSDLEGSFSEGVCEIVSIERQKQLEKWESLQTNWRKLIAPNDFGIEGDLGISAISVAMKKPLPTNIAPTTLKALKELGQETERVGSLFSDCDSVEDFNADLQTLESLIKQLQSTGKYPTDASVVQSRAFLSNIKKMTETGHFEQIKKLEKMYESSDTGLKWQILNELDGYKVRSITKVFGTWIRIFEIALPGLQSENEMWGGGRVKDVKKEIDDLICVLQRHMGDVVGESNDDN